MKKFSILLFIVFLLLVGVFVCKKYFFTKFTPIYSLGEVTLKEKTFSVQISGTEELRTLGLSGHTLLKDDEGMFFIFPNSYKHGFWMKDMLFPIDIIWIDENFKVVHVEKSVSPNSYPKVFYPKFPAKYVLEVLAGESEKLDLKPGDELEFSRKNP